MTPVDDVDKGLDEVLFIMDMMIYKKEEGCIKRVE